jgi:hypothetical protein
MTRFIFAFGAEATNTRRYVQACSCRILTIGHTDEKPGGSGYPLIHLEIKLTALQAPEVVRERLRQFRVGMIIDSNSAGTTVLVTIPMTEKQGDLPRTPRTEEPAL